jgi:hypothetical protein
MGADSPRGARTFFVGWFLRIIKGSIFSMNSHSKTTNVGIAKAPDIATTSILGKSKGINTNMRNG